MNSEGPQANIYMYPFSPKALSIPGCHVTLIKLIILKSNACVCVCAGICVYVRVHPTTAHPQPPTLGKLRRDMPVPGADSWHPSSNPGYSWLRYYPLWEGANNAMWFLQNAQCHQSVPLPPPHVYPSITAAAAVSTRDHVTRLLHPFP